jgi:heme-degrading monooxygenase HmoA
MPWRSYGRAEPGGEYIALLSYLPLKSHWRIYAFLRYSSKIAKQLSEARGLLGYSLLARPLTKRFWTLSVWENGEALREFVEKAPHVKAMGEFAPHIGETKFTRWKVRGSELPPGWDQVLERMRTGLL